ESDVECLPRDGLHVDTGQVLDRIWRVDHGRVTGKPQHRAASTTGHLAHLKRWGFRILLADAPHLGYLAFGTERTVGRGGGHRVLLSAPRSDSRADSSARL